MNAVNVRDGENDFLKHNNKGIQIKNTACNTFSFFFHWKGKKEAGARRICINAERLRLQTK